MKFIFYVIVLLSQAHTAIGMNWLFKKDKLADFKEHIKSRRNDKWALSDEDISGAPVRVQLGLKPEIIDLAISAVDNEKKRFKQLSIADRRNFEFDFYSNNHEKKNICHKTIFQLIDCFQEIELKKIKYATTENGEVNCIKKAFKKLNQILNSVKQNHSLILQYGALVHLKIRMGLLVDQGFYEHKTEKMSLYKLDSIPEDERSNLLSPESEVRKRAEHHRFSSITESNKRNPISKRSSAIFRTILLDENGDLVSNKTLQQTFPDLQIYAEEIKEINDEYKNLTTQDHSPLASLIHIVDNLEISLGLKKPKIVRHSVSPTEVDRLDTPKREELREAAQNSEKKRQQIKEQKKKKYKNPAVFKENPNAKK
jgi:hypothetical protein